jgi:hypothetical protein
MSVVRYHFLSPRKKASEREVVKIDESSYSREKYFNQYKGGKEVVIFDESDNTTETFLTNVYNNIPKNDIILLPSQTFYQSADKIIDSHIQTQINKFLTEQKKGNNSKTWVDCLEGCQEILKSYIDAESISTAYYIRLFANSIIYINTNNTETSEPLKLKIYYTSTDTNISGKITEDHAKFYIAWDELNQKIQNTNLLENSQAGGSNTDPNANSNANPNANTTSLVSVSLVNPVIKTIKSRLIMGFGPSAAGKTFLTKLMIKLLLDIEGHDKFPNTFISIDGGIIREVSFIYQFIIQNIKLYGQTIEGFNNLVSASGGESLFDSNIYKKNLINMLSNENNKYKGNISLYIPDTISDPRKCNPIGICEILDNGLQITNDKDSWIGLLIWQHTLTAKCNKKK